MLGQQSFRINVAILGSTGYTGLSLVKILLKHPLARIKILGSESYAGKQYTEIYPELLPDFVRSNQKLAEAREPEIDLECKKIDLEKPDTSLRGIDLVFFATPNGIAYKHVPKLSQLGINVIDLSADYRFKNLQTHQEFYGFDRSNSNDQATNAKAVYSVLEFCRDELKASVSQNLDAKTNTPKGVVVANPGCYTTATICALTPLLRFDAKFCSSNLIKKDSVVIDGKSGISGAGRKASTGILFSELNESTSPYKLGGEHRHGPELEEFFTGQHKSENFPLTFSPHLVPQTYGLLVTCYASLNIELLNEKFLADPETCLRDIYEQAYWQEKFIQLLPVGSFPKTKWVVGTNNAIVQVNYDRRLNRVIATCAIDNLIKGASGQAVQNMNFIYGLDESLGL